MRKNSAQLGKIAPSDITPYHKYLSRRALLAGGIGLAAAQTIGRFGGNAFGAAAIGQSAPATLTYTRNAAMSVMDTPNSYMDITTLRRTRKNFARSPGTSRWAARPR